MEDALFKDLLLAMARQRSVQALLDRTATDLSSWSAAALVRIWLVEPGAECSGCAIAPAKPLEDACMQLVASAPDGKVDEHDRRVPLDRGPLGRSATTGAAVVSYDIRTDPSWSFLRTWPLGTETVGFVAQPLSFDGSPLGCVGCLLTRRLEPGELDWLRLVADHAASTIINARAFEEIERLRDRLRAENVFLREEIREARSYGDIVGHSHSLRNVLRQIDLVAPTDASVLILGESGTGKELVAREIHRRSRRSSRPIIRVNCASIPAELYESEFFGHKKGAFTGATADREGRFAAADGGTLFLDEVGEIPLELQSKLLRVLQEGQYERVGDERTRTVDVRLVAATNWDLQHEVESGQFRQDLFYRLNVFPITVAPLRQRREDIPDLARRFLELAAQKFHRELPRLTPAHVLELQHYGWPGNVRELQNVIERAVIASQNGSLELSLPRHEGGAPPMPATAGGDAVMTEAQMKDLERANLQRALERTSGKIYGDDGAAALLGVKPTTLVSRMAKLNLGITRRRSGAGRPGRREPTT